MKRTTKIILGLNILLFIILTLLMIVLFISLVQAIEYFTPYTITVGTANQLITTLNMSIYIVSVFSVITGLNIYEILNRRENINDTKTTG